MTTLTKEQKTLNQAIEIASKYIADLSQIDMEELYLTERNNRRSHDYSTFLGVGYGKWIQFEDEDGNLREVRASLAPVQFLKQSIFSFSGPLMNAVTNGEPGDEVTFNTPKGMRTVDIIASGILKYDPYSQKFIKLNFYEDDDLEKQNNSDTLTTGTIFRPTKGQNPILQEFSEALDKLNADSSDAERSSIKLEKRKIVVTGIAGSGKTSFALNKMAKELLDRRFYGYSTKGTQIGFVFNQALVSFLSRSIEADNLGLRNFKVKAYTEHRKALFRSIHHKPYPSRASYTPVSIVESTSWVDYLQSQLLIHIQSKYIEWFKNELKKLDDIFIERTRKGDIPWKLTLTKDFNDAMRDKIESYLDKKISKSSNIGQLSNNLSQPLTQSQFIVTLFQQLRKFLAKTSVLEQFITVDDNLVRKELDSNVPINGLDQYETERYLLKITDLINRISKLKHAVSQKYMTTYLFKEYFNILKHKINHDTRHLVETPITDAEIKLWKKQVEEKYYTQEDIDALILVQKRLQNLENFSIKKDVWREQFMYCFVDEYQDFTEVQLEILESFLHPEGLMMFTGDEKQAIFRTSHKNYHASFHLNENKRQSAPLGQLSSAYRQHILGDLSTIENSKVHSTDHKPYLLKPKENFQNAINVLRRFRQSEEYHQVSGAILCPNTTIAEDFFNQYNRALQENDDISLTLSINQETPIHMQQFSFQVSTPQHVKGLEFGFVIVLACDKYDMTNELQKNMLYVCLSRPKQFLFVDGCNKIQDPKLKQLLTKHLTEFKEQI